MRRLFILFAILLFAGAFGHAQTSPDISDSAPTAVSSPADSAPTADPAPAVQTTSTAVATTPAIAVHHDGLWFSTADGSTQLHVHGYIQADDRMFSDSTQGEQLDTFLFRKIRPLFEGTLFNAVDFRFMPDFGQNTVQIQEAFLELKSVRFAKLRVGKFKEPIGIEVLRADRDLSFVERSLASDLVPLRYIGAQVSGSVISDSISYEIGWFDGSSDGSNGIFSQWAHSSEGAARLFFRPFAATHAGALRGLGVGVGGSAGAQHGAIAGLKSVSQTTIFKYSSTAVANGQHNRLSPQAYYYGGPFGFLGEYVISSQEILNKGVDGRMGNQSWHAEASVMLTGEKNSYTGIRPRHSFEPNRGFRHLGAFELAVRSSQLRIDGDAFPHFANPLTAPQRAQEQGFGLNWYLNRYVKLTTDYEHTTFKMATGNVAPLHNENVLMSEIQLAF